MGVAVLSGGIITWFGSRIQSSEIYKISKHITNSVMLLNELTGLLNLIILLPSVEYRNKMYYYFVPKLGLFKPSITLDLRINGLKCLSKARQWPNPFKIHIRVLMPIIYIQTKTFA